jgi:hypothetical protein
MSNPFKEKLVELFGGPADGKQVYLPVVCKKYAYTLCKDRDCQVIVYNQDANNLEFFNYAGIVDRLQ